MRKIILEIEHFIKSMIYHMSIFFQKNSFILSLVIVRPLFCFESTKNAGLLIFNSLKQNKLIFNLLANRNWKKLNDSRKRAKILADNRKSHHHNETSLFAIYFFLI